METSYKNKNIKTVIFLAFFIFLSIPTSYSLFNNLNNGSYENINQIKTKLGEFNPFITNCVNLDEISNTLEGQKYLILPRDIYLSESLENISCLTKIVDVYDDKDSDEVILFFGRNNKINLLYTTSILFIYIFSTLFKSHYYFIFSSIFYQINLNVLNVRK